MAYFNPKVISNCTYLYVSGESYTGANSATLTFELLTGSGGSGSHSATINYGGTNLTGTVMIAISDLPSAHGVYEITVVENGTEVAKKLVMIHCDIDCCLVKLTDELLACECDCAKCATSLAKAQKIFLLLDSAHTAIDQFNKSSTSNSGYALDAANKYKKAKEMCDASCGCNC